MNKTLTTLLSLVLGLVPGKNETGVRCCFTEVEIGEMDVLIEWLNNLLKEPKEKS